MDFLISPAFAQDAAPSAGGGLMSFLPLIILFGIFYFMLIRPQMKRSKEQRAMISALKEGDEVITNGGIMGTIRGISETAVVLEIAADVRVHVQKQAVNMVLPKGTLASS